MPVVVPGFIAVIIRGPTLAIACRVVLSCIAVTLLAVAIRSRSSLPLRSRAIAFPPPCGGVECHDPSRHPWPAARCQAVGRHLCGGIRPPQGTGRHQLLPEPLKVFHRGPAPLVKLQKRDTRTSLEDPPHQAAEHARRADLHKSPHPDGIQLVDDVDPADRLGHLPHEALPHRRRVGDLPNRRAAVDRQLRSHDRQRRDRGGQATRSRLQKRRMEWAWHSQPLGVYPAGLKQNLDRVDHAGGAADHVLPRCIGSTDPRPASERRDGIGHRGGIGDHREHGAVAGTVRLDRFGAGPRRTDPVGHAPGSRRGERRKLTEAVARHHVRGEAKRLKHTPGKQVAKIHRPLGIPDPRAQAVVGPPGDLGKGFAAGRTGDAVKPCQHIGSHRRSRDEALKHVGVLGALPGKDRRDERPLAARLHS